MTDRACATVPEGTNEIVIYEGETAKKLHKEMFSLDDSHYAGSDDDIVAALAEASKADVSKLHIAAGWESMLRIALWRSSRPLIHDVIGLLKKAGVSESELSPFAHADISDLFPWLYYGKRFEVLRKICNKARERAALELKKKNLLVYCHLVSEETAAVVASSL